MSNKQNDEYLENMYERYQEATTDEERRAVNDELLANGFNLIVDEPRCDTYEEEYGYNLKTGEY